MRNSYDFLGADWDLNGVCYRLGSDETSSKDGYRADSDLLSWHFGGDVESVPTCHVALYFKTKGGPACDCWGFCTGMLIWVIIVGGLEVRTPRALWIF